MNVNIKDCKNNPLETSCQRAIADILTTYRSDVFNSTKATTLRVIDLLYKLGYYVDSESLFIQERVK